MADRCDSYRVQTHLPSLFGRLHFHPQNCDTPFSAYHTAEIFVAIYTSTDTRSTCKFMVLY